jgi:putative spermidine/putrescine transport system ATP-binding protein
MLDGRAIDRVPPHKRELGMVFQSYALFPHMTVEENIAFPLQVRGIKGDEAKARVKRALAMIRLADFGKRRPSQLSGGQQQRVALARALVFEPKMVLMDEPLGALDKQLREQLQSEIKELHATLGVTVLYVTHDQQEALTLSDRVAVFKDGCIQQIASPSTIYERPETCFVAQFLGETNALTGTVRELKDGYCLAEIAGNVPIKATPVKVSGVGMRTTLSIRPERIAIDPDPAIYPNVLTGQAIRTDYFGDHIRTMLQLPGGQSLMMKLGVAVQHAVVPDTTIRIGWKAEDCRALDAPESGGQSVDVSGERIDR